MRLIESVPNVSEGRRPEVVDRLAAAITAGPGAHLLDRTSDASHNRSVFTIAGEVGPVTDALERLVATALDEIDMELQTGEHPRIGAVDVVPFVPLAGSTMDDSIGDARAFGARIADRFGLPVYLYAAAASRPDRVRLPDVRRGQYEGLKSSIATDPGRAPDFGPARMHPRGGATAVGARPFLVAWNINLESRDLDLAKAIAASIRESSGGLPAVQAKGFWIEELGCAQVSMNLLDTTRTPIWRVWETVVAAAAAAGVEPRESELIGLAPLAAFLDVANHAGALADAGAAAIAGAASAAGAAADAGAVADAGASAEERVLAAGRFLRLRDAAPEMALELRLRAATGG